MQNSESDATFSKIFSFANLTVTLQIFFATRQTRFEKMQCRNVQTSFCAGNRTVEWASFIFWKLTEFNILGEKLIVFQTARVINWYLIQCCHTLIYLASCRTGGCRYFQYVLTIWFAKKLSLEGSTQIGGLITMWWHLKNLKKNTKSQVILRSKVLHDHSYLPKVLIQVQNGNR